MSRRFTAIDLIPVGLQVLERGLLIIKREKTAVFKRIILPENFLCLQPDEDAREASLQRALCALFIYQAVS